MELPDDMLVQMFGATTDKIFEEAGVPKERNMDWYNQCLEILNSCMAKLSRQHGLSMKRVELYEEQKKTLVQDLIERKRDGLTTP